MRGSKKPGRGLLMCSDVAIRIKNISKCYQIYDKPENRLKQFVFPKLQNLIGRSPQNYYREFWALRDVSFEVKKGETVGIIGRNGSGKSTLLQIICDVLTPTTGSVETNGRIGALLELGSGFNFEFTGRENVYLNGAILGLSKEQIDIRFDDIWRFADIGDFIDQPVKSYSSGMVVRLAFAVQSQLEPDILIVDEALAVGDAKFQAKCFERLKQLKENGTSILLVTHSGEQIVSHCNHAVLLDGGRLQLSGPPRDVVNRYVDLLFGKEPNQGKSMIEPEIEMQNKEIQGLELDFTSDVFATRSGYNPYEYRWGDGKATILDFFLKAGNEDYPATIPQGTHVKLKIACQFNFFVLRPIFGVTIKTKEGITVFGTNSNLQQCCSGPHIGDAGAQVIVSMSFQCNLGAGDYFISLGVAAPDGESIVPHDRRYDSIHFVVPPADRFFGLIDLNACLQTEVIKR